MSSNAEPPVEIARKLLRGEVVLTTWMDLTLTTHRLWQYSEHGDGVELTSFSLADIEWARVDHTYAPWLLWLGAFSAVASAYFVEQDLSLTYALLFAAALFMLLYATTRRLTLRVGARGREIVAIAGSRGDEGAALHFVDALETYKHARSPSGVTQPASSSATWHDGTTAA
ncbi:MAG: hypothetical protein R3A51_23265 [Nannocystaceae bacterium]|nr:hypothetical protein [Myxococcales bacterium]